MAWMTDEGDIEIYLGEFSVDTVVLVDTEAEWPDG
jgi:hypothetical protein